MRKSVIASEPNSSAGPHELNVDDKAQVEVSSEDPAFPIENAFHSTAPGWRAQASGKQTIRLVFDSPVPLSRTLLEFKEHEAVRTQQFTLTAQTASGDTREILRQQWNFSPTGSGSELEDVPLNLGAVKSLTLEIIPDISHGPARASLARWLVFSDGSNTSAESR